MYVYDNAVSAAVCAQECIDEEEDMTDSCSGVGRREVEADSGISRTDDSLRNDESSEHEIVDTDSASPSSGSGSAKYAIRNQSVSRVWDISRLPRAYSPARTIPPPFLHGVRYFHPTTTTMRQSI